MLKQGGEGKACPLPCILKKVGTRPQDARDTSSGPSGLKSRRWLLTAPQSTAVAAKQDAAMCHRAA